MSLFSKYFSYGRPDEMPEGLYNSKRRFGNYNKLVPIHQHFDYIANRAEITWSWKLTIKEN